MDFAGLLPLILVGGLFYLLILRPQIQERQAHETLVGGLKKGDKVVTSSGLHGRISAVHDNTLELDIADRVRITIDRTAVARLADDAKGK